MYELNTYSPHPQAEEAAGPAQAGNEGALLIYAPANVTNELSRMQL